MDGTERSTLRAKYLDWCSARLAERVLDLSTEEIYALARPDEAGSPDPAAAPSDASGDLMTADASGNEEAVPAAPSSSRIPRPTEEGYRVLVQRVTEALLSRTSLPTFEQWAEAYAETPERFDAELLGFWKDAVDDEFIPRCIVPDFSLHARGVGAYPGFGNANGADCLAAGQG